MKRIHEADAVFIVGIQSTRGTLTTFHSHLEYIRPKVYYVDGLSGTYAESLNSGFENPYAIISDCRAYSRMTRTFCKVAVDNNLPLALITDLQCPWARDYPLDLLQLKTDVGQFWDSTAPLACLLNSSYPPSRRNTVIASMSARPGTVNCKSFRSVRRLML